MIRPRLLKVTGVAEAFIQGGDRKQYQVLIDPAALLEYEVTLNEVEAALRRATSTPAVVSQSRESRNDRFAYLGGSVQSRVESLTI